MELWLVLQPLSDVSSFSCICLLVSGWCRSGVSQLGLWPHQGSIFWKLHPVPRLAGLVWDQVSPWNGPCICCNPVWLWGMLWQLHCCVEVWWWLEVWFSAVCWREALLVTVDCCWWGLPKALEEPDSSWYYLHHTWQTASWWSLPASQWSHDPLGSGTACSQDKSPVGSKFLYSSEVCCIVTDGFLWSTKYWKTETQSRNHTLRSHWGHLQCVRECAIAASN